MRNAIARVRQGIQTVPGFPWRVCSGHAFSPKATVADIHLCKWICTGVVGMKSLEMFRVCAFSAIAEVAVGVWCGINTAPEVRGPEVYEDGVQHG